MTQWTFKYNLVFHKLVVVSKHSGKVAYKVKTVNHAAFFSFQNMECSIQDLTNYQAVADQARKELSNDKNRFVPMEERQDTSVLSVDVLASLCHGKTCMIVNSL